MADTHDTEATARDDTTPPRPIPAGQAPEQLPDE